MGHLRDTVAQREIKTGWQGGEETWGRGGKRGREREKQMGIEEAHKDESRNLDRETEGSRRVSDGGWRQQVHYWVSRGSILPLSCRWTWSPIPQPMLFIKGVTLEFVLWSCWFLMDNSQEECTNPTMIACFYCSPLAWLVATEVFPAVHRELSGSALFSFLEGLPLTKSVCPSASP